MSEQPKPVPKIWLPDDQLSVTVDTGGEECTVSQMRVTMTLQPVPSKAGFGAKRDE